MNPLFNDSECSVEMRQYLNSLRYLDKWYKPDEYIYGETISFSHAKDTKEKTQDSSQPFLFDNSEITTTPDVKG